MIHLARPQIGKAKQIQRSRHPRLAGAQAQRQLRQQAVTTNGPLGFFDVGLAKRDGPAASID
jgi:hypothetical protein